MTFPNKREIPEQTNKHLYSYPLKLLMLIVVAIVLAAIGGCRSTEPATDPEEQIQLVYQDWRTDWFPGMAQQMLDEFHATHPNIRVFYTPDPDDVEESMLADMEAGTAPDVFQGCCTFFPIWAQKEYMLDIRPYVEADLDQETISEWDPAQYNAFFTPDGLQYGLPKYHGALGLYFNKDFFDEYGVAYPDGSWDHTDYTDAMTKLTDDRDGDGKTDLWGSMIDISWDRIQMHINGWGGHIVDPDDNSQCRLSDPEAMAAMEWIRARMWDDKVMATPLDVQNLGTREAFIAGKIAMVEDGSWALKDILADADFRVGLATFPSGPSRRVTLATTDGYGIFAGTEHPDAAWELLKFLVSKDYGRAMARANFLQPARSTLVDEWANMIREEFPEKASDLDIAAFADGHINGYSVTTEIFPNMDEAKQLTYEAWDQIFVLGIGSLSQMQEVCAQIQEN